MNTFRPSIDWSREFLDSTFWVLQVWVITATVLLVVLFLVGRTTEWGRQFWRVTGDYFKGRQSAPVWVVVGLLLLSAILVVRINVLLSYYANDLFSALQVTFQPDSARDTGIHGFWLTILVFAVLAVCYVARTLADLYLTQTFIMRWRIWLSRRFIDDWLGDYAYFRSQFSRQPIDNPDQRIQQDIDIFTAGVGAEPNNPARTSDQLLLFGAVEAVVSVFSFAAILWRLSGPLTLGSVTLPRALFWIVIFYVLAATFIAFVIGRPLIRLSFMNELLNAGFRYALIRLRDASAAVGLYRTQRARRSSHGGHGQLRQLAQLDGVVHRLEPVDEPGDRSPPIHRSGAAAVRARNLTRRYLPVGHRVSHDPQLAVLLSGRLRLVRQLSGGDHPLGRLGRRERPCPQVRAHGDARVRGRPARGRRPRRTHSRRPAPDP
jgi:putative ATP-binding cassette transporter